ncbi:MAG: hypothetical protein ACJAZE_000483 [Halioglobus sp.]|jgi:hypothetical protein
MLKTRQLTNAILIALSSATLLACSTTGTSTPSVASDGLALVPNTKFQEVYRDPNADLSSYTEIGLAPCKVAFKKNWMRDQNSNRIDFSNRVTQKDVDRIKDNLSSACDEKFRAALLEDPAYAVVEAFTEGEHVLVLHPSIINLNINAPDVRSAGMSRTYTTSSGEMTLKLELEDATTGAVIARAIDKRRGVDSNRLQWSSSVSNTAEANRTLSRWAKILREGLDEARQ